MGGSDWLGVEVYATFMKLVAEIEIAGGERLSDSINRARTFIQLRNASAEPLSSNYPVISRKDPETTVAKSTVIMISPRDDNPKTHASMWREKQVQTAAINTSAFSMVCDVHLESRRTLEQHLERALGDFLPVTNVSALWIAAGQETHALQRPFALVNPAAILSFSKR